MSNHTIPQWVNRAQQWFRALQHPERFLPRPPVRPAAPAAPAAPADDFQPAAAPKVDLGNQQPTRLQQYTVQPGDTLSAIAAANGTTVDALVQANGIQNRDLIFPGQQLQIPGEAAAPAAPAPDAPAAEAPGEAAPGEAAPGEAPPAAAPAAGGANTDRNAIYLQQPNGWTCGPTSLTMAEAAWGVAPSNVDTMNRLSRGMGVSPDTGVPGNASLIAEQAKRDGLQASYNSSNDAAAVSAAIDAGHTCVVNGSLSSGGHFLYVAGKNPDGSFIIADPARPNLTRMTADELTGFMRNNSGQHPPGFAEIWK
ncbi:MAG: LysM peptidoglycan-binding domain-containing protein [Myxococcaceae bacterium]|nr:LysM peptidoglycan-binding domain-containing protein [Myxococcaceae bacterium]